MGFHILISRYVARYYRIKGPSSRMGENTQARKKLMVPSSLLFFEITDQIPSKTLGQKTASHERSVPHIAWSHQELQMFYTSSTAVSSAPKGNSLSEILGSYPVCYSCQACTDKNWQHVEEIIHKAQGRSKISSIPPACSMSDFAHGQAKVILVPKPLILY